MNSNSLPFRRLTVLPSFYVYEILSLLERIKITKPRLKKKLKIFNDIYAGHEMMESVKKLDKCFDKTDADMEKKSVAI